MRNDRKVTKFQNQVWSAVKKIPKGKVATYQGVAEVIGSPLAARAVGNALSKNPCVPATPCHRVVRSDGGVGGYSNGAQKKTEILRSEGVAVKRGRVASFKKILHKF